MLQVRHKWVQPKRNLTVGDVVLAKENKEVRSKWPVGRIVEEYPSKDSLVRKVKLLLPNENLDEHGKRQCPRSYLDRPIHKVVLLLTASEVKDDNAVHQETKEVPNQEPAKNT